MTPVLAVNDPDAARRQLQTLFGFKSAGRGRLAFGDSEILVIRSTDDPYGLIRLPLDHVAFQVPDILAFFQSAAAQGAVLDHGFTPSGIREIPEFWENGVSFVFFRGPDDTPVEFCTKRLCEVPQDKGHSHFAIRSGDMDRSVAVVEALGGTTIASHFLNNASGTVDVRFMSCGSDIFELFDEAPVMESTVSLGWIGLLDE